MKYRRRIYYTEEQKTLMWDKRPGSGRTVGVVTLPEVHIDISVQTNVHYFRTGTLFVEKGERLEQSQIVTASANLESGGFLGVSPGPGSAVLVFLHQTGPEGLPVHHGPNYIRSRNGRTTDDVISTEGRGLRPASTENFSIRASTAETGWSWPKS